MQLSVRFAVVALFAALAVGMIPLDPGDTNWTFQDLKSKVSGKAKKIGKLKLAGLVAGDIQIADDGSFTGAFDGTNVGGAWTRKNENSKRLDLVLDKASAFALAVRYATDLENNSPVPIDVTIGLDLAKTKLSVKLKPKKKKDTVTLKLKVKLVFAGVTSSGNQINKLTKVKAKINGISEVQALGPLLGDL